MSCTRYWPGSSVGIATYYGLDGPGIESRWGRDFPHLTRSALVPTQPPVQWVSGLSRSKERPQSDAHPSLLLVSWSRKSRAIFLLLPWAVQPVQSLSNSTRVHFTFSLPSNVSNLGTYTYGTVCLFAWTFCYAVALYNFFYSFPFMFLRVYWYICFARWRVVLYHICTHNSLPEDESSVWKRVEDIIC